MTLVKNKYAAADVSQKLWSRVTHRAGHILQASVSAADKPPYDPEQEWTEALDWSRGTGDEGEVDDGFFEIDAVLNSNETSLGDGRKELLLGVVRAKAAAQIVMREHKAYNSLVAEVIGRDGKHALEFRDEKPTVRFDPGLIVDLPSFVIKRGGAEVASGRICVTVCMNESRSKIWTRVSSSLDEAWGSSSCAQLNGLVSKSRAWFAEYAHAVQTLYAKNIQEALQCSGEKSETDVKLDIKNRLEFISADTELQGIGRLTNAITNGFDFTRDQLSSEAAERLSQMLRCAPGLDLADDIRNPVAAILQPTSSELGGGRYYFVPHRTSRGFRGVYAVRAQGDHVLFAGIAAKDSEPLVTMHRLDAPTRPILNSPSQHVTAELANTVAKYF